MKALGLTEDKKKLSRADALRRAQAAAAPQLPLELSSGVTVLRWAIPVSTSATGLQAVAA